MMLSCHFSEQSKPSESPSSLHAVVFVGHRLSLSNCSFSSFRIEKRQEKERRKAEKKAAKEEAKKIKA